MSIVEEIKRYQIRRLAKKNVKPPQFKGFSQSRRFGIFFERNTSEQQALELARWLEESGKHAFLLGFIPKKLKQIEQPPDYRWFCKSDLNWYRMPRGERVKHFFRQTYDVFIDLSLENRSVNLFVNHLVHTGFRIGGSHKAVEDYDLQVDLHSKDMENLKYFLQLINNEEYA